METKTAPLLSQLPRLIALVLLAVIMALLFTGCVGIYNQHRHEASSVVQFLYPDASQPFISPQIPTLRLPLRVGVAFVPPAAHPRNGYYPPAQIDEARKDELLHRVAAQFRALPFVSSIEIVPATYLRPGGGFENLDQVRALLGVDVIALVAYDQTQNTSDTPWSFSYWTVVGAYFVPGQKNDTHTLMEAVVYDIPSRNLLFRAPGVNTVNGHSTPIRTEAELREDSARSIAAATVDLTANLQRELDAFKARAKEDPSSIRIEHKAGYTGAGALDAWFAALLGLVLAGRLRCRAQMKELPVQSCCFTRCRPC